MAYWPPVANKKANIKVSLNLSIIVGHVYANILIDVPLMTWHHKLPNYQQTQS